MKTDTKQKLLTLDELAARVAGLRSQGRTVVHTHGVFDIIHPGIVQHLRDAAELGDVLVATVIRDRDVHRGPGRPVFPEDYRASAVAALGMVDYVCVVDDEIPFECVRRIGPHVFAKGQAYRDRDRAMHEKIFTQERELYLGKCEIMETQGFSFSSSAILSHFLYIYPDETLRFVRDFAARHPFEEITQAVASLDTLKVLVLGDGIVDQYHYCTPMGKSAKAQLVVNKSLTSESFAGGAFAVANHVACICAEVALVSLLGEDDDASDEVIERGLRPGVERLLFRRADSPTIVKKRYVDNQTSQKLFEINTIRDDLISGELEERILTLLRERAPQFDLVMVADFGHGLVTPRIIELLGQIAPKLAVNTQTNAANRGFNLITKYNAPALACLDEEEARLAMQDKLSDLDAIALRLHKALGGQRLIVTKGRRGMLALEPGQEPLHTPILSAKEVDTVGAGDAVFAYTAPCIAAGLPLDVTAFIGSAAGALAVQIVCNKESVEKFALLEFIQTLFKQTAATTLTQPRGQAKG